MGRKSGYLCKIDTGGKAIAYHAEQEKEFKEAKKILIHYMGDDFKPIIENGKEKTGLIDASRLNVMGMCD